MRDNRLSKYCYGTWSGIWGRKSPPLNFEHSKNKGISLLNRAISDGVNIIDTASMYGNGFSESIIGKVISNYKRENLFISTKVKGTDLEYKSIIKSTEESLNRLNTEYIDVLFAHWYNPRIPLHETLSAFSTLKEQGKIRNIGISNFNFASIKEAQKILGKELYAVQLEYNIMKRNNGNVPNVESQILPFCKNNGIFFFAYNPLDMVVNMKNISNTVLPKMANKYNKTVAQLAINWLLKKDVHPIIGTSNLTHLLENLDSEFKIDTVDIQALDNMLLE